MWNDLRGDKKAYKGKVMENFESLRNGTARVVSTAERLALSPTIGTVCYDSSMTTIFHWDGVSWVAL